MESGERPPGEGETPSGGWLPPAAAGQPQPRDQPVPGGYPPPAPGQGGQTPPQQQPGYWYPQQPPPQQQPGYWYPQQPYPQQAYPPGWFPQHGQPGNGHAVTGLSLSVGGTVLLLMSVGLSSILSFGLCVAGAIVGRIGRQKVDEGETSRHRGLGQAGFIVGIVGAILALVATAAWILFFIYADDITDVDKDGDIFEDGDELDLSGLLVRALARATLSLS